MKVEFVGQSARDADFTIANTSRLVNCYREPIVSGGRSAYAVKSVLGLAEFSSLPGVFVRDMATVSGKLFAVGAGALYEIGSTGGVTNRGAITDDADTTMAGNNGDVTIVADGDYWHWDGTTLTNPTPGAFSNFGAVEYIGNYTVLTEASGRRFQWSDLADATTLPGLNFSTADGKDDNLVRPFAINGLLYLFKETSFEVWYITGQSGANAFARQAGGVQDIGLKGKRLICRIPGSAFFVGSDGRAHLISGGIQPVSTPPVETAIQQGEAERCFAYEDEGHTFCVVTFRDRPAWVYDVSTGEWHERAEDDLQPWSASCAVKFQGYWYAGRDDGSILQFARVNTDRGADLIREATSRTLEQDGQRITIQQLELFPRQGFADGTITLSISRDGGATWSAPKARTSTLGNYATRMIWRSLGQARMFTAKVRWTDAHDVSILAEGRIA